LYSVPAKLPHGYCVAAEITHKSAVQQGTHAKQARVWKRWGKYNKWIGNYNLFLNFFLRHQQIKIIEAFALALHEGRFSGPAYDKLVESTISGTISYVCATFRENGFPNPSLDKDARTGFLLQQLLYWGFKHADPAEKHQKAISISCKYLKVLAADQQWTTILQLCSIRFLRDGKLISHDNAELESSDCVLLTFEKQKRTKRWTPSHKWLWAT
jgi:hypothetical protein